MKTVQLSDDEYELLREVLHVASEDRRIVTETGNEWGTSRVERGLSSDRARDLWRVQALVRARSGMSDYEDKRDAAEVRRDAALLDTELPARELLGQALKAQAYAAKLLGAALIRIDDAPNLVFRSEMLAELAYELRDKLNALCDGYDAERRRREDNPYPAHTDGIGGGA